MGQQDGRREGGRRADEVNQPVKNADGATFQLAMLTASDGSQVQCIALVGADGSPITAWPLPTGAATDANLAAILAKLSADPATQTTLAAVLAKLPAAPALESGNLATLAAKDFATQTTLAAVLAKLSADPATQTTLAAILAKLNASLAVTGTFWQATQPVSAAALPLPTGAASETTLAQLACALKAEDSPTASGDVGFPILAQRHDTDSTTTSDDGDYATLKMDEEGRLKVATKPASFPLIVGTANAVAATVICDVRRASNVLFHVKNVGSITLAAGTFVWEGSIDSTNGTDGTWFGIQAVRSNANTIETTIALTGITAGAGYAASWDASVNGCNWMRIRCTVAVTASASAQWSMQRGSYATEPIPAAQTSATQAVSGSITAMPATPTPSNINSAASINATTVKGSAGTLYNVAVFNGGAGAAYVKFYNKASAPAPAADIPLFVIPVAAGAFVPVQFGAVGHRFATGIALTITGGAGDTDATAVAAAQVKVATSYI